MTYLLDTHVFLWWITDNPKLSREARKVISDPANDLFLSTAGIWEIMIKTKIRKIGLPENSKEFIVDQISLNAINILNISIDHSFEIYSLPEIHKDPFDRMLIAQAKIEGLTIISADSFIRQYEINTYW
ncbi:MAG: type II toxin-antitoxin system VapC family toxin [Candidatus Aminicenantes bacterium]|nr:type II toxin-antitoxin system VapC family toxin [Candidatus Aminicenantes bacterium]